MLKLKTMLHNFDAIQEISKRIKTYTKDNQSQFINSVINIKVRSKNYEITNPWLHSTESGATGTGFVIAYAEKIFIVTNSHVVQDASFISIRLPSESHWYTSHVLVVDYD